ncbi:MAG: FAD-dependent oxidoreductase [Dehalococcoidia bacterium]
MTTPYWLIETPRRYPTLAGDVACDVVVIGGGISGTGAALFLAERGVDVALLEKASIAWGASGRNGGFVLAGTVDDFASAEQNYGPQKAREVWELTVRNLDLAEELAGRLAAKGVDCGYRRCGSLRLADSEEELTSIRISAERLAAIGQRVDLLDHAALPEVLHPYYLGGAFNPLDGEYDPAAFVKGLVGLAGEAGARIFEDSEVLSLDEADDFVVAKAAGGSVRAKKAIVCLNAYTTNLLPDLVEAMRPIRAQALSTSPLRERLFDVPCYGHYGYHWWRQLATGEIVAGGWRHLAYESEECADEDPCEPVQGYIESFVKHVAPQASIEQRWAGLMCFTPGGLPYVGLAPGRERTWVVGGYNGHGNGLALASVQQVIEAF